MNDDRPISDMDDGQDTSARNAERMRLFCEIYIEAFRKNGTRYTEGSYARTALDEFDKAFPATPPNKG